MQNSGVVDILDSLEDLGYKDDFTEENLQTELTNGPSSLKFTTLIAYLASELSAIYNLTETVNPVKDKNGAESFLFEISGFLAEYGCPYTSLTSGDLTKRLQSSEECAKLALFLISELQAGKMYFATHENESPGESTTENADSASTEIFNLLKSICMSLKMSKPPNDISVEKFFQGIANKLSEASKNPKIDWGTPMIQQQMGPMHFEKLNTLNTALCQEYGTRRMMLLKRVDVTIASFNWSNNAKKRLDDIAAAYQKRRHALTSKPSITVASLLAAREDLSQIYKTSSGSTRHSCAINKVVIGKVPDRGGRTDEVEAPPPEMPSWQKRQDDGGRGRGGGYRGGRGQRGGGRGDSHNQQQNYHNRQGHDQQRRPDSGRGGHQGRGGQSRWGRGRGGGGGQNNNSSGSFNQYFGHGGQTYGNDGFQRGGQVYTS